MAHIYTTGTAIAGGFSGAIFLKVDGSTVAVAQPLPAGITGLNRKCVFVPFKNRLFFVGQFSRPLIRTEDKKIWPVGINAPVSTPTLALGTGAGGSTGAARGYITFRHKIQDVLVHESNPSNPTDVLEVAGQGFSWTDLPTTSPDARVTHIAGYREMDGAFPRFAWERQLGVASVVENVNTLALGDVLSFRRGVPPYTLFAESYHDRMWYFGDPLEPTRIWYSEFGEPESVHPANFRDTRNRRPVTGGKKANEDQLVIYTRRSTQDIQGYTGNDFNVRLIDPSIGCVSHFSIVNIQDRLWFASEKGVFMFDGALHYMMKNLRDFWKTDFKTHQDAYSRAYAADDREFTQYKLLIPNHTPFGNRSFYYLGDYLNVEPSLGGDASPQPLWDFDIREREDTAFSNLSLEESDFSAVHTGSTDGFVREENIEADPDDDGDLYLKKFVAQSPHDYFEEVGGDKNHGKRYTDHTLFLKNEDQAATLDYLPGDDSSADGLPTKTKTIPVGAVAGKVARISTFIRPGVAGEGLTRRVTVLSPTGVEYKGDAGAWEGGVRTRGNV